MTTRPRTAERSRAVERLRERLLRRRMPRLQMSLIVMLTDPFDLVDVGLPDIPGVDLDEGIVVVPVVIALAGFLAAAWVVYSAPVLFAELILDGIIVSRLYRRFRNVPPEGWLTVAIRRTRVPLLMLVVALSLVGFAAGLVMPGADSIGDVFSGR